MALGFGALAGALCIGLSIELGARANDAAALQTGRYLARLAMEYRGKLEEGGGKRRGLDLPRARAASARLESSADPALPVELMLLDAGGRVMVGPPALEGASVALPRAPVVLQRWPDGHRYIVAISPARDGQSPRWSTLARARADQALAPVASMQRRFLWAGLLLALGGLAAGWVLATRHTRALEELTRAAQDIAAGKARTELPRLRADREVASLAEALRAMLAQLRSQAESLREAQERLQRRVHERTAELVQVQAELELEIADAKLARDDLARAHARLAFALEGSGLSLWDLDVASGLFFLSASAPTQLARDGEAQIPAESFFARVPDAHRDGVRAAFEAAIAGASGEIRLDHPLVRRDGTLVWIANHGRVLERGSDGRARRLIGTHRELIARARATRAGNDAVLATTGELP